MIKYHSNKEQTNRQVKLNYEIYITCYNIPNPISLFINRHKILGVLSSSVHGKQKGISEFQRLYFASKIMSFNVHKSFDQILAILQYQLLPFGNIEV